MVSPERGATTQEQAWRGEFPITRDLVYLNNCSLTPLHRRGRERIQRYAREGREPGGGLRAQAEAMRGTGRPSKPGPVVVAYP